MTTPIKGERQVPIDVTTTRTANAGDVPALAAYAFSSGGSLLDMKPLDEKGNARLSVPATADGDALRIVLGPQPERGQEKERVDVGELLRRGAVDAHVDLRADAQLAPVTFELDPELVIALRGRRCVVKGTLVKRVISGGITRDLPVCNAAVDIWEVDPWPRIIPTLPDFDLGRLRDIVDGPWPPIDLPIPPRPVDDILDGVVFDPLGPIALNPQPLPPREVVSRALTRNSLRSVASVQSTPRMAKAMQAESSSAATLPADLRFAARAARPVFERAILANIDLLRPILCWLYPQRVRKTKIATAFTDRCGHFKTVIWRSFLDPDVPDLYFTARQRVFPGFWITILEQTPVACHTWWNYQCGTEVTLVTRHPAAHGCAPCGPVIADPRWVLFMAVGNTSTWGIHGANSSTAIGTPGFDPARRGLLQGTAPWGGTLRPRLEFDSLLRSSLNVKYYRVSYKRPSDPDTDWRFSTDAVNRHYTQTIAGAPVVTQYPLGPNLVGGTPNLYEIPPALPPVGQWSLPNVVLDSQSAVIGTTGIMPGVGYDSAGTPVGTDQSGLLQVRVELFDAAGVQVDPEALGIKWYVPATDDLGAATIPTQDAATLGLVDAARNCMILTLRVDNNPCFADIGTPTIDGVTASPGCGVMNYTTHLATVTTPFTALQRNRFADYSFYVQRGEGPGASLSSSGQAPATAAGMPAAPSATAAALLGGCAIAGFTEQLYVAHRATDGWSRQVQYDASDVRAFVLAPA